ncbi:hypothetical protein HPB49_007782 [Dermacentor silvarum]|uniref:Uncharacterized protein n=1 Tax=Dermacentor silvarum TaxID=543639 RepID=A0ACB8DY49_DERSI|nr:hypothetical protein HPB49_007782 [Dermacentor silvarum]
MQRKCTWRRNGLLKTGFTTPDNKVSIWAVREAFLRDCNVRTLKVMPALTETHLDPNSFEKMRVSLAFQLFGTSVLRGRTFYKAEIERICGSISATQEFFVKINKIITAMTSRFTAKALRPGSTAAATLVSFLDYLNISEACGGAFLSNTTPAGLRVTISSTLSLLEYFTKSVGYRYLMTSRLSIDPLENFFGIVRQSSGCNAHPSPERFLVTVNLLSFYNLARSVDGANASPDVVSALISVDQKMCI